jgi:hypothetical protein
MKLFKHLINWCDNKKLNYYCGFDKSREFYLISVDKKIYAYDFTIPEINLIFEFHGKFWHIKNPIDVINELGVSLLESYKKDQIKKRLAEENGFKLIEVFEEDGFDFNFKKITESISI